MSHEKFSNAEMDEIYSDFMESDEEPTREQVPTAYKEMRNAFDEYLAQVQTDLFYKAFRFGYSQGWKAAKSCQADSKKDRCKA